MFQKVVSAAMMHCEEWLLVWQDIEVLVLPVLTLLSSTHSLLHMVLRHRWHSVALTSRAVGLLGVEEESSTLKLLFRPSALNARSSDEAW